MFFRFCQCLYKEYKNQSTPDGYKSHSCLLLIGKRIEDGLVPYLFSQRNDTKRESKWRRIQTRLFFLYFLSWCCEWKMKLGITDHIPLFLFCFWIRKQEKETWLPYSHLLLWNRRTKNERMVYTTYGAFPFFLFSSCKRKNEKRYNVSYFCFSLFVRGLGKRKRMLNYPFLFSIMK